MIRVGESAWLLELDGTAQVLAAYQSLLRRDDPALLDVVPGARTLLVVCRPDARGSDEAALAAIERDARATSAAPTRDAGIGERAGAASVAARTHEIAVRYDGEDLPRLAERTGITRDAFIERHTSVEYRVSFVGFQPGFAYLAGLPPELHAPRRASPRPRVPAGSVAIGGEWTGIYPTASPGGWHLLGTTDAVLFDPTADPPARLQPGDVVRFVPR